MRSLVFRLNVTPTPLVDPRPADVLPHVIGSKFKFILRNVTKSISNRNL